MYLARIIIVAACLGSASVHGHESKGGIESAPVLADSHAPVGVMGDHRHKKGEWMVSYRYMQMRMDGNLEGGNSIAASEIVTQPNPFPGPANVRVVPEKMQTDMHMLGVMYAPSDRVTLMAMVNYLERDMQHTTFAGMTGATLLGEFRTSNAGFGDTKLSSLWGLYSSERHQLHLNMGVSIPTGSITAKDTVLTPMNTAMKLRLPYAMQLGSGTWDVEPGITYRGVYERWGWGAQYGASIRMGENDEDYQLGDTHQLTAWGSYRVADAVSISARLNHRFDGDLDGADQKIMAPVTTANTDNYGGRRSVIAIGLNLVGQKGALRGHRVAMEYLTPIDQDLNGIQMDLDDSITFSYQYAF
tara:strand:+ start:4829 stop:5902 length:1074 start_codon:yes stop_codon:yes gene_type:complete